ncbi:hypothetical protein ECA4484 [Pectobacterium atrosepticum SCRI1043]|uniref:Uncharacterized protein n=1 Tax=Pectobacterium atrosepticum (strain SCRI 1043 / ATCC BAA-672) TaxID=218491 RepID=Q6CYM3_PECAS|nr:hypothetical protein ECA4484 [Pectobacterium atrosepticum SCRI1043]
MERTVAEQIHDPLHHEGINRSVNYRIQLCPHNKAVLTAHTIGSLSSTHVTSLLMTFTYCAPAWSPADS